MIKRQISGSIIPKNELSKSERGLEFCILPGILYNSLSWFARTATIPQTKWLKQQKFISHEFWRLSLIKMSIELIFFFF